MRSGSETIRQIASSSWMGAEGERNGMPVLIRARNIPYSLVAPSSLPMLFVVSSPYQQSDHTGLPSSAQYDALKQFERRVIDAIEEKDIGVVVGVVTSQGVVNYLCYVRNTRSAMRLLSSITDDNDEIDLAADEDKDWEEYKNLISSLS